MLDARLWQKVTLSHQHRSMLLVLFVTVPIIEYYYCLFST